MESEHGSEMGGEERLTGHLHSTVLVMGRYLTQNNSAPERIYKTADSDALNPRLNLFSSETSVVGERPPETRAPEAEKILTTRDVGSCRLIRDPTVIGAREHDGGEKAPIECSGSGSGLAIVVRLRIIYGANKQP